MTSYLVNGAAPRPRAQHRQRPQRAFTEADLRAQQSLLLNGGDWEDQYDIPARPWSGATEAFTHSVALDLEAEDYEASQARRRRAASQDL